MTTKPAARKAAVDTRKPLWVLLPNGTPVPVASLDAAPAKATHWCREGDETWTPCKPTPKPATSGATGEVFLEKGQ